MLDLLGGNMGILNRKNFNLFGSYSNIWRGVVLKVKAIGMVTYCRIVLVLF